MKSFILHFLTGMIIMQILVLCSTFPTHAGTCSSISYTPASANSVLTSTKYNTDNTTVYNFVNAYDGGCVSSLSLESDALSTDTTVGFAAPLNGIFDGCKVTRIDAGTLAINDCIASVNNNWIKTATNTNVNWTHLDTGAEATGTLYYVYIDSTSSGTTLTPVLSTTGPGTNGLNGSDRVLARVANDGSGDFVNSIKQWKINTFESTGTQYDLTVTGPTWTTSRAKAIYYESLDGTPRIKFNIIGTASSLSRTSFTITISGISTVGSVQAVTCMGNVTAGYVSTCLANSTTDTITINHATATTSSYRFSGDIELSARPAWAN